MAASRLLRSNAVVQLLLLALALMALCTWYQYYNIAILESSESIHNQNIHISQSSEARNRGRAMRPDGLLDVNMTGQHPLWSLLEDAEKQWRDLNARQSRTLAEAATEYTRRNGFSPPAGFDLWWEFVQNHNVKLVDEFDQINYDITPYLALSPKTFRTRVAALFDPAKAYHINITNGQLILFGPQWNGGDQRQVASMMGAFSRGLPDLSVHGYEHLRADQWIGKDLREAAQEKVRVGQYFTEEELQHFESLERNNYTDRRNVCLPDDPVFRATEPSNTTTFVASHFTSMCPCSNPRVRHTPPFLFSQGAHKPRLIPRFVFSKHRPDSGFLLPSNMWEYYDPLLLVPHTWRERSGKGADKLSWRGRVTGWNWSKALSSGGSGITWRDGLRAKLALMFGTNVTQEVEVLLENKHDEGLVIKKFDQAWLNELWMDIGLTGDPVQCSQNDGTCEEMRRAPIWKDPDVEYMKNRKKFVVDIDSNGWSEEFQKKLSWGNVVLKATLYPEWNTQWLIPYYHYIPIQTDFSDVYNIMAFFLGDPATGTGGHESVAEEISRQASDFARKYWRWEDMQAYLFRLMLEYARLCQDDREAASFSF